ncbi:MAG: hypothetical protein ABI675_19530 [Chitinophagaceae bacterium]
MRVLITVLIWVAVIVSCKAKTESLEEKGRAVVKEYLKTRLHDPGSYDEVSLHVFPTMLKTPPDTSVAGNMYQERNGFMISLKYRAKNDIGATVLNSLELEMDSTYTLTDLYK